MAGILLGFFTLGLAALVGQWLLIVAAVPIFALGVAVIVWGADETANRWNRRGLWFERTPLGLCVSGLVVVGAWIWAVLHPTPVTWVVAVWIAVGSVARLVRFARRDATSDEIGR